MVRVHRSKFFGSLPMLELVTSFVLALSTAIAAPTLAALQAVPPQVEPVPSESPRKAEIEAFRARLVELAKSAPPRERRGGDHSITGRVVTEAGEPLAGVLVRATANESLPSTEKLQPFIEAPRSDGTLGASLSSSLA